MLHQVLLLAQWGVCIEMRGNGHKRSGKSVRDFGASIIEEGGEGIWWELNLLGENRVPYYEMCLLA